MSRAFSSSHSHQLEISQRGTMTTAPPKRKAATYFREQQRILELQQEQEEQQREAEQMRLIVERLDDLERQLSVLREQLRRELDDQRGRPDIEE